MIQTNTLINHASDRSLYEFDLIAWRLLHKLACQQPELAVWQFQITPETVAYIARADEATLRKLASGVLLSFQPKVSEHTVITCLKQSYDLSEACLGEEFNTAYWLLLNQVAVQDADMARVHFGLSEQVVQAVRQATNGQLRQLARAITPRFSLRCTEQVILGCLSSDTDASFGQALFQKLGQSLQNPPEGCSPIA